MYGIERRKMSRTTRIALQLIDTIGLQHNRLCGVTSFSSCWWQSTTHSAELAVAVTRNRFFTTHSEDPCSSPSSPADRPVKKLLERPSARLGTSISDQSHRVDNARLDPALSMVRTSKFAFFFWKKTFEGNILEHHILFIFGSCIA